MSQTLSIRTRMDAIQSPIIQVLGRWIQETPGTISLGQGVVHYGPPPAALDAVRASLTDPATHEYQDGAGLPPLIERLSAKLRDENGITVGAGTRVMVTAGGNMAFVHAVLAITEPGDEVILNAPFYFNHEMAIQMAGCTAVVVATDDRYQPRIEALRAAVTDRTRAIVTVSPNNPSGAVFGEAILRDVNALCRECRIYHISDEVYEYFTYGSARHVSPASFSDAPPHTISMFSLSKAYGFAGWRIGYFTYPEQLAPAIAKIQDTVLVCPTVAAQAGAIAAIDVGRDYCRRYVAELADVRDIVIEKLRALAPFAAVPAADGAFYVLLQVDTALPPMRIAERLIREHKVAVIPGPAFGMTSGCFFRVAYGALQKDTVAEGMGRLVNGLREMCVSTRGARGSDPLR
jgi:aspartate/methionine/tyrosine aminotransferase